MKSKKILAGILALILTTSTVALPTNEKRIKICSVGAEEIIEENDDFEDEDYSESLLRSGDLGYRILNDGNIEIAQYTGKGGNVMIPSEIDGKKVTRIGCYNNEFMPVGAFEINNENSKNIKSITIPETVTEIDDSAFYSGNGEIIVDENNSYYSSDDGILYNKNKTKLIHCPTNTNLTTYVMPDSVTEVNKSAFCGCPITSITVSKNLTDIKEYTFAGCKKLKTINLPEGLKHIGWSAFEHCESLENIKLPESVQTIDSNAFRYCISLKKIEIPQGITAISDMMFDECHNLETVTIPESVQKIKSCAFSSGNKITEITLPASIKSIESCAFPDSSSLKKVYYKGSPSEWSKIKIGQANDGLDKAEVYFVDSSTKQPGEYSIKNAKISGLSAKTYTGKQIKPDVKVVVNGVTLRKGNNYSVTYSTNKIGKGYVTITGRGSYKGKITKSFVINPRKTSVSLKTTKGKITVSLKRISEAKKYQIQYSTNSKFKGAKTVSTTAVKKSFNAKSKKTYYVRARSVYGKYLSSWSAVKKIKVK